MSNRKKIKNFVKKIQRKPEEPKVHEIRLKGSVLRGELPWVECTCGFKFGPDENVSLLGLGKKAKQHSEQTGHVMRPHYAE